MAMLPSEQGQGADADRDRDIAFSRFYRGSVARLTGRCVLMGVQPADAPGIVQELMLEIYRRWGSIDSAAAYANSALPRRAAGFLRDSSFCPPADGADLARSGRPLVAGLPDGVLAVDGEHLVLEALEQLPATQRAVFALAYDDYSCVDIGQVLDLKEATVRSHLRHARRALKAWWAEGHMGKRGVGGYDER
jgi:RNA polymerase sigma-70 factor (ECF subfamily)